MTGSQQRAARRRHEEEESKDYAKRMGDFVTEGVGALFAADDAPEQTDTAATPALGWDAEEEPAPAALEGEVQQQPQPGTAIVKFSVTAADIAATKAKYAELSTDTKEGAEAVRQARRFCVGTRVAVNTRRKELKAESLAYCKNVESEAQGLIALILEIEEPLDAKIKAYDADRQKEKDEALRKKNDEIAAKLRAEREAEDAERKAKHEAEAAQIAADRAKLEADKETIRVELEATLARQREEQAERDAAQTQRDAEAAAKSVELEAERQRVADAAATVEKEREAAMAQLAAEREAFEAEKRELQAQKDAAAKAEADRLAKIDADRIAAETAAAFDAAVAAQAEKERLEAAERAEAERVAAEAKAEADRLAAEAEAARLEAMRPDVQKLQGLAKTIRAFCKKTTVVTISPEAAKVVADALNAITKAADDLDAFAASVPAEATAAE